MSLVASFGTALLPEEYGGPTAPELTDRVERYLRQLPATSRVAMRAVEMARYVRHHYPQVKILARAFDVNHLYLLNKAGVDIAVREMFEGSLELGKAALKSIGLHPFKVEKMSQAFRKHDESGLESLYELCEDIGATASELAGLQPCWVLRCLRG